MDSARYKLLWSEAISFLLLFIHKETSFCRIIFLTWRLTKIPFLQNLHVVSKILTSSVGIRGNGILDQKRNHIATSFTGKNKLKVFT